jgi:predicted TIM-barrel fold metal-dependent hydrolase
MKHLGIQSVILSVPAPGACAARGGAEAQSTLARRLNENAAKLRDDDHARFGFFATLPDLLNTSNALAELEYALDTLQADGVALHTRYGPGATYLGHSDLEPVWRELDRREATVFVHPTLPPGGRAEPVSPHLPLAAVDFPHETARAALDLIASGTLRRYPNVKVILSHAGGTLPLVLGRVLALSSQSLVPAWLGGSPREEMLRAFRSFYYDLATATEPHILRTLQELVPADRIVFGVSATLMIKRMILHPVSPHVKECLSC